MLERRKSLVAVLLVLVAPSLAQKPPLVAEPAPLLVSVREDTYAALGNDTFVKVEARADGEVVVASGPGNAGIRFSSKLSPGDLAALAAAAGSPELARLGDYRGPTFSYLGDRTVVEVRIPRAGSEQVLRFDALASPEALPRALRRVLCPVEKIKEDAQVPGTVVEVHFSDGRQQRIVRRWCDFVREQRGCETRAGDALLEAYETEQLADANADRSLLIDTSGVVELTTEQNYSPGGLRRPVVRACMTLSPAELTALRVALDRKELRALAAMPAFVSQHDRWRGYTLLVHRESGVQALSSASDPVGATRELVCVLERIEHRVDEARAVSKVCEGER